MQTDVTTMSLEELKGVGFEEYNKIEAAKATIAQAQQNINFINVEIGRRQAEAKEAAVTPHEAQQ